LCKSSDVFEIIQAFVTTYHFDTVYIADINAISQQGNHHGLINEVLAHFPDLKFWIDSGYRLYNEEVHHTDNYLPVLGSESYRDDTIFELQSFGKQFILSLDYKMYETMGSAKLFSSPTLWPDNIIIMTLDRVGSHKGPDFVKLTEFCNRYPNKSFIAAGGIRNQRDLIDLKKIGIRQVLIASALHNSSISPDEIINFRAKKYPG
jgi:phosphoribosylformimino-5-aminoimidazole carboxamide ribotide isomerase